MITAVGILALLIFVLGAWMKGADVIALPGFGIVIATPLMLILLIMSEVVAVLIAAYFVRLIPFSRLLFGETGEL